MRKVSLWIDVLALSTNALVPNVRRRLRVPKGLVLRYNRELLGTHFEPGIVVDDALVAEVKSALQACAHVTRHPK